MTGVTLVRHPLVQHKVTRLRDRSASTKLFKELVDEISMLLAYEATASLALEPYPVETPLESHTGVTVQGKKLTVVPILRAGLGMVEGVVRLVPGARVGHIGLYRDHDTLEPVDYYFKVPADAADRAFLLLDPMLATGGSAAAAVTSLKRAGAERDHVHVHRGGARGDRAAACRTPRREHRLRGHRPRAERAGVHRARPRRRRRPPLRHALSAGAGPDTSAGTHPAAPSAQHRRGGRTVPLACADRAQHVSIRQHRVP